MIVVIEPRAKRSLRKLPPKIRQLFQEATVAPKAPGLQLKKLNARGRIRRGSWSVRLGMHYRAVVQVEGQTWTWYWVGSREAFTQLGRR